MATKVEPEYPSSPNEDSEADAEEEEPEQKGPVVAKNVSELLKRLHSQGAILKKPKQEYLCKTCNKDFTTRDAQLQHLLGHVSLPSVVVDKLPSDDEDGPPSGDDWSDEEEEQQQPSPQKTPQKIDISQIMQKTGISIKNATSPQAKVNTNSALNKLTGLGFTIKKNSTPIKEEKVDNNDSSDIMKKLGQLGGIKLKLKSEGGNSNNFQVVNGLKDFKTSDDDDDRGFDSGDDDFEKEESKEGYNSDEQDLGDTKNSDDDDIPLANKNRACKVVKGGQNSVSNQIQNTEVTKTPPTNAPLKIATKPGRPAVKQTPRRGANLPIAAKTVVQEPTPEKETSLNSTPERRVSHDSNIGNVTVKQEVDTGAEPSSTVPLFSGQIKEERSSPPLTDSAPMTTPIIAQVKTESDATTTGNQQELQGNFTPLPYDNNAAAPIMPVPKKEEDGGGVTVIEINGDSDGDDDCCVVSATPAADIKPVIPKTETITPSYPPPAYSTSQSTYSSTPGLAARLSVPLMEKQHNFNWNAPDSKPAIDILEKSTDDIFDSLFSGKRDNSASLADASEYISLDTLGPQHSCEVCNTRFTSLSLLDEHKRQTGHSTSLVMPSSSTLLPYNPSSNILSSLLPVKHLADQVGKLGMGNSSSGFSHQQNVLINIQAYPGAGGMAPPQGYNSYGQNMHGGYQQPPNNMYMSGQGMPGQPMPGQVPGQYPNQNFMGQQNYGQQFGQQTMPKPGYPGSSSPFSTASPLQSMQQAVYGQSSGFNNQMGQMGPPGSSSSQSNMYVPASSPSGVMKPPASNNIQIQNVQTFPPGQLIGAAVQQPQPGDMVSGQMGPGQMGGNRSGPGGLTAPGAMGAPGSTIRMAPGANVTGARPRMPNVRGIRPSIRPGIQVQGQLRGAKPRMPIKRPAGAAGGPGMKRRNDMLLPGKHDNEDCQVMAMQKQRQGMPMIESVQGAKDKLNLGSQISITKKTVNKQANAMANVLASRGISIKQKQKSRSPSPERPIPHIPNLGAGVSIKHTSKSSSFSIPEAKVGGGMQACKICQKMFMSPNSLAVHMNSAHPGNKSLFKCDECPASYPKSLQLQHHKRVFHNVNGPNRELGLPVVDLSQEENIQRLSNLGIYSFIPLANREQEGGCFGIPIISVHNMQNGMTRNLQALGADGLLSLGPLKPLPHT